MPTPTEQEIAEKALAEENQPEAGGSNPTESEKIAKLEEENRKIQANYEELRKTFNKRDEEIAELRKKRTEMNGGSDDTTYLKGLGFMSKEEVEAEIQRREDDRKKQDSELSRQRQIEERASAIKTEMEDLMKDEKHGFINKDDLLTYMKSKPGLMPKEAAKLKYEAEFDKLKSKNSGYVPETDQPGKGGMEQGTPKKRIGFGNMNKLSESIRETVRDARQVS